MNERLTLANALVGFVLPHVIALVNQRKWKPRAKSLVAFGACIVAGALTSYVAGDLGTSDLLLSVLTVFGVARVSYAGLWQPTGIAPAIEKATSS